MADQKMDPFCIKRFDRPAENLVAKDTTHVHWFDEARAAEDKSQHRRYHGLFEDLMN